MINPDDLVGVLLERSEKMIIALLGILKSGAAYVPLDPEYPVDRIEYMLEDSSPKVVLSERSDQLVNDIDILDINEVLESDQSVENLETSTKPHHLAYVIYTSGSTGAPKGTLIEHRSIIRLVRETDYISIGNDDIVLQLSNYAFDGSVFDIYGSLLNGAKLVLIDKDDITDINKLSNIISINNISVFFVTTALFNTLVDINLECLSSVRKILFGGEQCSSRHIEKAIDNLGCQKIIHVYGPTESTVYSTFFDINQIVNDLTKTYPIGSPINNTSVYILDKGNNPTPLGVPGELCISGVGLARGYLNRP